MGTLLRLLLAGPEVERSSSRSWGPCESTEDFRLMVPQLLNCSLSFASMLEEARSAESDADFISKCCIGLKEARESWTRMRVCQRCRIGPHSAARVLVGEGNELIAIVTTIIKNKRKSVAAKRALVRIKK